MSLDATVGDSACLGSATLEEVELVPASGRGRGPSTPIAELIYVVGNASRERDKILRTHGVVPFSEETEATLGAVEAQIANAFKMVDVRIGGAQEGTVFDFVKLIGSGSNGTVAEYHPTTRTAENRPLAVKVCYKCETGGLLKSLSCNVVKTAVFNDAKIQVMEMGTDIANVPVTPVTVAAFERFSNSAALCFDRSNVACPDWKPGNLTAFANPCGDSAGWVFRVIDVDGVARLDVMSAGLLTVTLACTLTRNRSEALAASFFLPTGKDNIARYAAHALVNTAYAIEVSKVLFATRKTINRAEMEFLVGIRQALVGHVDGSANTDFSKVHDMFFDHGRWGVPYPKVQELLTRFRNCKGEWRKYRQVYRTWFEEQTRAETEIGPIQSGYSWMVQKFVDLTQTRPR